MTAAPLAVTALCPSHGPVVKASLTELLRSYQSVPSTLITLPQSMHIFDGCHVSNSLHKCLCVVKHVLCLAWLLLAEDSYRKHK